MQNSKNIQGDFIDFFSKFNGNYTNNSSIMSDELNQYEMMEEKLRRELLKYEASFEPDDWALMEEKLENEEVSYFAFSRHPYFRLAAAALLLLTSLYGVESLINVYLSPAYEYNSYTNTNTSSIEKDKGDSYNNSIEVEEGESIVSLQEALNQEENDASSLFLENGELENSNYSAIHPSTVFASYKNLSHRIVNGNKADFQDIGSVDYFDSADEYVSLVAHSERNLSILPVSIPYNHTLVQVADYTIREQRRLPGKRKIKRTIRTSKTSIPEVVKNDVGRVSLGVFGSVDLNFVDFSTAMQSGHSAGMEVKIKPKKEGKFSIVTGVGYSRKKFKTTDVPNNPLMSFLNADGFGYDAEKNISSTFTSEMEVVEVPLLLQYEFGEKSKKVKPYVEAGATVYVPASQKYTYLSSSNWNQTYSASIPSNSENSEASGRISEAEVGLEIRGEHENGSRKPYLGIANVNAGLNIQVSNRLNVHLEGQVKTSLAKHKFDRSIPESEMNINLNGGNDISENKFNNRKGLHTLGLQLGVSCAL